MPDVYGFDYPDYVADHSTSQQALYRNLSSARQQSDYWVALTKDFGLAAASSITPNLLALAGTLGGAGLSYLGTRDQNIASAQQADKQMEFQREMANTQIQRGVADALAAGLNPMLGARGASAPVGAMAPVQNELAGVNPALASALQLARFKSELSNLEDTGANIRSQTFLNKIQSKSAAADANLKTSSAQSTELQNQILALSIPRHKAESEVDSSKFGKTMRYVDRALPAVSALSNSAKTVQSLMQSSRDIYNPFRNPFR